MRLFALSVEKECLITWQCPNGVQIRQGDTKHRAMKTGEAIKGDDDSVKAEFVDVFTRARSDDGEKIRQDLKEVAQKLREERDGKAAMVIGKPAFI